MARCGVAFVFSLLVATVAVASEIGFSPTHDYDDANDNYDVIQDGDLMSYGDNYANDASEISFSPALEYDDANDNYDVIQDGDLMSYGDNYADDDLTDYDDDDDDDDDDDCRRCGRRVRRRRWKRIACRINKKTGQYKFSCARLRKPARVAKCVKIRSSNGCRPIYVEDEEIDFDSPETKDSEVENDDEYEDGAQKSRKLRYLICMRSSKTGKFTFRCARFKGKDRIRMCIRIRIRGLCLKNQILYRGDDGQDAEGSEQGLEVASDDDGVGPRRKKLLILICRRSRKTRKFMYSCKRFKGRGNKKICLHVRTHNLCGSYGFLSFDDLPETEDVETGLEIASNSDDSSGRKKLLTMICRRSRKTGKLLITSCNKFKKANNRKVCLHVRTHDLCGSYDFLSFDNQDDAKDVETGLEVASNSDDSLGRKKLLAVICRRSRKTGKLIITSCNKFKKANNRRICLHVRAHNLCGSYGFLSFDNQDDAEDVETDFDTSTDSFDQGRRNLRSLICRRSLKTNQFLFNCNQIEEEKTRSTCSRIQKQNLCRGDLQWLLDNHDDKDISDEDLPSQSMYLFGDMDEF